MSDFFQDLVFSKNDVITFPAGIPGFEVIRDFVIVSLPNYHPFEWLASVDGSKVKFPIINPLLFSPAYNPVLAKEQLSDLLLEKPEDVVLYVIVTIRENPLESTANLVGPVIINKSKKIGKQIILDDARYSTQEPILRKK